MFKKGDRVRVSTNWSMFDGETGVVAVEPDWSGWLVVDLDDGSTGLGFRTVEVVPANEEAAKEATVSITNIFSIPSILTDAAPDQSRQDWNLAALETAAEYDRRVQFKYKKPGVGQPEELRTLHPSTVIVNQSGNLVVVGQDEDRDDVRAFRIDRIVGFVSIP